MKVMQIWNKTWKHLKFKQKIKQINCKVNSHLAIHPITKMYKKLIKYKV